MATNPYEVEHNIKPSAERRHRRRLDMSTFAAHHRQLTTDPSSSRLGPTPVDVAAMFQNLQDQFGTLTIDAPTEGNRNFLISLMSELERDVQHPPDRIPGVDQLYLDCLERMPRKKLQADPNATCPICAEKFIDDPHPLVVELPCHGSHTFDLECVGPWLLSKGTCPMCRADLTEKKTVEIPKDEEEDEDPDGLYG